MSVWAFQHVPECAIDHAFVATISSLHSESPKESACLSFFVVIVDSTVRQVFTLGLLVGIGQVLFPVEILFLSYSVIVLDCHTAFILLLAKQYGGGNAF